MKSKKVVTSKATSVCCCEHKLVTKPANTEKYRTTKKLVHETWLVCEFSSLLCFWYTDSCPVM